MPATSQSQYRAMQAAAHGSSTLGIPKKVGEDFADATPSPGQLPKRAPKRKGSPMADAMRRSKGQ